MTDYSIVYTDDIPVGITTEAESILYFKQPQRHPGQFEQYKEDILKLNQTAEVILAALQGAPL